MYDHVDPFIGTGATDLPAPEGLAATWWWPKPQVGNTHPGATYPFGMVSACAYSGAYPTGYGTYDFNTEGVPPTMYDGPVASGFTHFQQSGTGAIRKYYNYFRVTPMLGPLDDLGTAWDLLDEEATPGYYAATLGNGIRCELTVGPKSAVHRYTFPAHEQARIVVDASTGGLAIDHGRTVPLKAHLATLAPGVAQGEIHVEGVPLAVHLEVDAPGWRQLLWYDRRLMPGGTRLDFDYIRPTTLRPFGLMFMGPSRAEQTVEVRLGFSLRGPERAHANLLADVGGHGFTSRHRETTQAWRDHLGRIEVQTDSADQRTVFSTALYHSLVKPCFAADESPSWTTDGPYAFDICTLWDVYRTQLPLMTTLFPHRSAALATSMLSVCEQEGNLPIGYRMAKGADRFSRQGSALAHTFLADLCDLDVPGIDWEWAMVHLEADLRRTYGEDYLVHGVAHPISHTLDLAYAYHCTARIARRVRDRALAEQLSAHAEGWRAAYDTRTGLLVDSTFYEGGRWNYSFRLLHDMRARIALAGGDEAFVALLDRFFGYDAAPVTQPGARPGVAEMEAGYALGRFEGLNNEPDYEAPWAYYYAGRPDRTAEVVQAVVTNQFGTGRGGLPGNDDSGGLSAWYVWATLGLFPVAGQNLFLLGAPAVGESTVKLPDHEIALTTTGFAPVEPGGKVSYVQSVQADGRTLERPWVTGRELRRTRHLHVELGPEPSAWGTRTRPPSTSDPSYATGGEA
ncbi:glycoside hydrolase domain-containing protein [Luteipulveratus halotolerans]|uniref:Glycoside hydrolase n=1 Tax=Luteipulveratus halotolerans TaxID=1631356 RepID=A0A0L6CP84_9MICO|nr:glycoside hydrolase domain-containing protein [Luteipulveratus halotolerans]KNX39581.1 glycoside hydrolase [Luteipulveratus halotolerans]